MEKVLCDQIPTKNTMNNNKDWSNICANIHNYCAYSNNRNYCTCYQDYLLWSKDNPKLDFESWRILIKIEMKRD